ncbi:Solute carrier family 12 member 7 [Hordeum vulgare]|nr:Solute carrier family 12 member 7 [Hordeum vulgare]
MENGEIEAAEEGLPMPTPPVGRKYRPVWSDDSAVVQMTSMERSLGGSTSVTAHNAVTPQPPRAAMSGCSCTRASSKVVVSSNRSKYS